MLQTADDSRQTAIEPASQPLTAAARLTHLYCAIMRSRHITPTLRAGLLLVAVSCVARAESPPRVFDLSLLVASDRPCTWPQGWPVFQLHHHRTIGPLSPYHVDTLLIDPNTGTQMDVPPHSIPPPDSELPNAGPAGLLYTERIPSWQFCGEACVIDCRDLLDAAENGTSPLITKAHVHSWEAEHRPLRQGDVALFFSGYSDRYYRPLPEGRRFLAEPLEGTAPAWPDPDPDCMEYLASRGVMTVGTDSPSIGPIPDLAEPTHVAGLRYGMIFTEGATGLGQLSSSGTFYCMLGPKHQQAAGSEVRALAIAEGPLAARLIESARRRRVVDLSVPLAESLPVTWPGSGVGNSRQPYYTVRFGHRATVGVPFQTHLLDSHAGTHLVPPAYALPAKTDKPPQYSPEVIRWRDEYEARFGPLGTTDRTVDQVPIGQTCGPARVVDVRHRIGSTSSSDWPASPPITADDLRKAEKAHGRFADGDIVILQTGWSDQYLKPLPDGAACMDDPLNGRSEGWPALTPEAVRFLAECGVRCVCTDAPTVGGVDPQQALMTYWALGAADMVAVEFLTNIDRIEPNAFFIFAAIRIRGAHGAPGRAIVLH